MSIRIPDDLIAEVGAWAAKREISRNAAYALLLEAGLKATAPTLNIQVGPVERRPGAMLKVKR